MSLSSGSKIGPSEITAQIGVGGMGEVFRSRDGRLQRDVALKVLRDGSTGPDRQGCFALEARAASALNHPNILTVHDVGMEDGLAYIVSEVVDGEPLRAIIRCGPIPARKTLDIAVQIAEGLTAAHGAGIVHRDLKPANIMINRAGLVKILDFGLAKPVSFNKAVGQEGFHYTAPAW